MKIGIDFGTTYSKISYLDADNLLREFRYPGPAGPEYVPTAVAYRNGNNGEVYGMGEAARLAALNESDVVFCENFKMLLPMDSQEKWRSEGWTSHHTPAEVTLAFFRRLLREDPQSFENEHGPIDSVVVSVPEVWQRTPNNPGADRLQRVLTEGLGLPLQGVRSEPVCAAAYFVYRYKQVGKPFSGNLLVCDMGGGTFDVALCQITGQTVTVLDFDGNGQEGLGSAGVSFDRRAVRAAYQQVYGEPPNEDAEDFVELLRAFEETKIQKHYDTVKLVEMLRTLLPGIPMYTFRKKYKVSRQQFEESFEPVAQGIRDVLARLMSKAKGQGHAIHRVAIVGGFGQFPPVQQTILEALGIERRDPRFDPEITTSEVRAFAIARGAAVIANGLVRTVEPYPHTLALQVTQLTNGQVEAKEIPIVEAGKVESNPATVYFARGKDGQLMNFEVRKRVITELPVKVQLFGQGEWVKLRTGELEYPPVGRYNVGMLLDRSNLATLVFRPVGGANDIQYPLGRLSPIISEN
jgi:molecular chaperone DnaK